MCKTHSLPNSLHYIHHELFSHSIDVVQVSITLVWKHGVDI